MDLSGMNPSRVYSSGMDIGLEMIGEHEVAVQDTAVEAGRPRGSSMWRSSQADGGGSLCLKVARKLRVQNNRAMLSPSACNAPTG